MATRALNEKEKEAVERAFIKAYGYVHNKYGLDETICILELVLPRIRTDGTNRKSLGQLSFGDCYRLLAEMVDGNIEISW